MVDVSAYPFARPFARVASVPAGLALGGLVLVSAAVRWLLALGHTTAYYFPDEYIYSEIARGVATGGTPAVRGVAANFPAVLEPVLAAPFWLTGDVHLATTLTQGLHATAVSVAAVPAYLLARELSLGKGTALALAALAVLVPDASYASFVLADPIAYPLALGAVYAGVRALNRSSARSQVAFLALAGLAAATRIQYVVLPVAFVIAAAVVDGRRAVRTLRPTLALAGLAAVGLAALGPSRALGYYEAVLQVDVRPLELGRWAARDAMVLAYAAGWILVPGALAGLAAGLARPRSRAEAAFAAVGVALTAFLIGQSALYETNALNDASARVHERYVFVLVPLVGIAFALWARRGTARRVVAVTALALLAVSARVPLSGYTVGQGKADSPTLRAVSELQELTGLADGSLAVAIVAAILSLAAVTVALRPSRAALALAAALVVSGAVTAGASSYDFRVSGGIRERTLPADKSWIDNAGVGPAALLLLPRAEPTEAFVQLYWNRSVERVLLLGSPPLDAFGNEAVRIADDGTLVAGGRPVRAPLLVQEEGSQARFTGTTRVAEAPGFELLRPDGAVRLELLAAGFFSDGRVSPISVVTVWSRPGTLRVSFHALDGDAAVAIAGRRIELRRGERRVVEIAVPAGRGPWTAPVSTNSPALRADAPTYMQSRRP